MTKTQKHDVVFIDFDETLFDHPAMNTWLDHELTQDGHIKKGTYKKSIDDYHEVMSPVLRMYRHEDHFYELTGTSWSYWAGYIKRKTRGKSCLFCYEDSHAFLYQATRDHKDVRILSFGNGDYQRFKMSMCRVIGELDLPIHIVTQPKTVFLQDYFSDASSGILVDDKYPLRLPANIKHVLIDRGGKYAAASSGDKNVQYYTSLADIKI